MTKSTTVTDDMLMAARREMKPFVPPNDETLRKAIAAAINAADTPPPSPHVMGCNPLQERAIYDRVRSAYDQGYNDARVAGNVARDGAPGYRGRDKQAEIGAELLSDLRRPARAPAEHEVVTDEMATTYKAAFRVVFDRWLNDENGIPQENIGLIATKAGLQAVFDSLANEGKP